MLAKWTINYVFEKIKKKEKERKKEKLCHPELNINNRRNSHSPDANVHLLSRLYGRNGQRARMSRPSVSDWPRHQAGVLSPSLANSAVAGLTPA